MPAEEEEEEDDFDFPQIDLHPYWSAIVCNVSGSKNIFVRLLRKYVRFSSYYFTVFVGALDTLVMILLAKHLWRAWWVKPTNPYDEGERAPQYPLIPRDEGRPVETAPARASGGGKIQIHGKKALNGVSGPPVDLECDEVRIEIGVGDDLRCMDDNFLIEVILAALDFFRVSETKQG